MSAAYYIKAYYTKQDQQPEIRRFSIDISPENDAFKELQTKIASFQSDSQLNNFTLQYNDEENERITFSSNDELRAAIALNKDGNTLKVFVTFNQTIPQQQQQQQPTPQDNATNKERHADVVCDGCNGPVIGLRYKCFVCPNYDLCEKCSSAGIHSEHNMIKITKPSDFQHPHGPQHRPHHHSHGHHHGRRQRPMTRPPFIPGPEVFEQIRSQIPQWLPNQEHAAQLRTHVQQHLDTLKNNTQAHMQNSKQYLESVGQYLQQALSPFGIDCDYRVDGHEPTTTTTTTTSTTSTTEQQQQPEPQEQQQEEQVTSTTDQQQEEQISSDEIVPPPEPSAVPKYPDLIQIEDTTHEQTASASASSAPDASTQITNPLEKSVDDCMERMAAMGFTDSHGALRDLIRSKQGDINAVLDAINPRHHQA